MGILRTIFFIAVVYWIVSFIRRHLIPYFNNVSELNQRQKEHAATVDYKRKSKINLNKQGSEYIEFEEK